MSEDSCIASPSVAVFDSGKMPFRFTDRLENPAFFAALPTSPCYGRISTRHEHTSVPLAMPSTDSNDSVPVSLEKKVSIFSFFSCSGFLDLGFERAAGSPYEIRMANEIDANFRRCYRFSREHLCPPVALREDFFFPGSIEKLVRWGTRPRKADAKDYERFVNLLETDRREGHVIGFIGGPPCPDFSRAGLNAGKDGEVGPLSRQYVRIINQQQPDFFLLENVKGLASFDKHKPYFDSLCRDLRKTHVIAFHIVNALWYGVPQFRERLIIVGIRKDLVANDVARRFDKELNWESYQPFKKIVARFHKDWPKSRLFKMGDSTPFTDIPSELLDLTVARWWQHNDVEHHPNQNNQTVPKATTRARYRTIPEGNSRGKSYHRLHRGRYSFTACYGHNEVPLHPWLPRRISVAEALATQSLPKDFSLPVDMGISPLFKAVGNGVPFLMAKGLAEMIAAYLKEHNIVNVKQ